MKKVFEFWECFYADILNNKNEIDNLLKIDSNEVCVSEQKLKCEIEKFNPNNKGYIDNLLTLSENHPLADIGCVYKIEIMDESVLKYVYKKFFFK